MAALTPAARRFVLHWGEMGTRWGINRTVAQIHALLYVSQRPLPAEEIAETLDVARSNVSTSLKELQGWGIVKIVHQMGDRRDHFVSLTDVWEMFRIIMGERKRREIDPTLQVLRECMEEAGRGGAAETHAKERVGALLEFFETMDGWYRQVSGMPVAAAKRFVKLGGALGKVFRRGR